MHTIRAQFGLYLAKPNQATLLRSGEMELLARNRSPISPDLGWVWLNRVHLLSLYRVQNLKWRGKVLTYYTLKMQGKGRAQKKEYFSPSRAQFVRSISDPNSRIGGGYRFIGFSLCNVGEGRAQSVKA